MRYAFLLLLAITITSCAEDEVVETLTEAPPTTTTSTPASSHPNIAFDFLYKEGVSKYLQEEWEDCVNNLKLALKGWHYWNNYTARCRRNCSHEASLVPLLSNHLNEEDRYFERTLHSTLCLVKCKRDAFGSQYDRTFESNVIHDFRIRKPYDYLQLCYFKLGKVKEAADASATVLAVEPDHKVMIDNLKYYLEEGNIKPDTVVNMELKPYGEEYIRGTLAYQDNNFDLTITHMEKSLELFYEEYKNCRFLCESPFDQGWFPDFVSSIANHFTFTLRCKRRCFWQLSDLYGEIDDTFLASHFDYLQYSYFQKEQTAKACEAVASFLTLLPDEEVQNRNKEFYLALDEVTEDMFVPRKEVVALKEREDYEESLLQLIETNFAFLTDEFWAEDDEVSPADQVGEGGGEVSNATTTTTAAELDASSVIVGTVETVNEDL